MRAWKYTDVFQARAAKHVRFPVASSNRFDTPRDYSDTMVFQDRGKGKARADPRPSPSPGTGTAGEGIARVLEEMVRAVLCAAFRQNITPFSLYLGG